MYMYLYGCCMVHVLCVCMYRQTCGHVQRHVHVTCIMYIDMYMYIHRCVHVTGIYTCTCTWLTLLSNRHVCCTNNCLFMDSCPNINQSRTALGLVSALQLLYVNPPPMYCYYNYVLYDYTYIHV